MHERKGNRTHHKPCSLAQARAMSRRKLCRSDRKVKLPSNRTHTPSHYIPSSRNKGRSTISHRNNNSSSNSMRSSSLIIRSNKCTIHSTARQQGICSRATVLILARRPAPHPAHPWALQLSQAHHSHRPCIHQHHSRRYHHQVRLRHRIQPTSSSNNSSRAIHHTTRSNSNNTHTTPLPPTQAHLQRHHQTCACARHLSPRALRPQVPHTTSSNSNSKGSTSTSIQAACRRSARTSPMSTRAQRSSMVSPAHRPAARPPSPAQWRTAQAQLARPRRWASSQAGSAPARSPAQVPAQARDPTATRRTLRSSIHSARTKEGERRGSLRIHRRHLLATPPLGRRAHRRTSRRCLREAQASRRAQS